MTKNEFGVLPNSFFYTSFRLHFFGGGDAEKFQTFFKDFLNSDGDSQSCVAGFAVVDNSVCEVKAVKALSKVKQIVGQQGGFVFFRDGNQNVAKTVDFLYRFPAFVARKMIDVKF